MPIAVRAVDWVPAARKPGTLGHGLQGNVLTAGGHFLFKFLEKHSSVLALRVCNLGQINVEFNKTTFFFLMFVQLRLSQPWRWLASLPTWPVSDNDDSLCIMVYKWQKSCPYIIFCGLHNNPIWQRWRHVHWYPSPLFSMITSSAFFRWLSRVNAPPSLISFIISFLLSREYTLYDFDTFNFIETYFML